MPPHDRPHRPQGPHHGRGPAFLDRARLDELLVPLVPDAGDRDFVARCLVGEGPAHHRGANFILVSLLGRLLERLPGEDAGGGGARVPMRLPPHLQDELEAQDFPLLLPTRALTALAGPDPRRLDEMVDCLTDGPPQHALANVVMVALLDRALGRLGEAK